MRPFVITAFLCFHLLAYAQVPAVAASELLGVDQAGEALADAAEILTPSQQDWRFAHPGATLVGGVRLGALLDSPIVNQLMVEGTAKLSEAGVSEDVAAEAGAVNVPEMGAMLGMFRAFVQDVVEVRYSMLDPEPVVDGDLAGDGHIEIRAGLDEEGPEPDVLVLVTGQIDRALVEGLSQGKLGVREIEPGLMLLGTPASLDGAVERMRQPRPGFSSRAVESAATLSGGHDFWIAGHLPETGMTSELNTQLRSMAMGLSLQQDLDVELALDAATAPQAEELVGFLRNAVAMQPEMEEFLDASTLGTTARLRFAMPGERLLQTVREGSISDLVALRAMAGVDASEDAPEGPTAKPSESNTAPPPSARNEPSSGTIRIEGLRQGPREVPVSRDR